MAGTSLLAAWHAREARDRVGIELRAETPDDLEFAAALYASTRSEELAPVPWPEPAKCAFLRQQFEAQHHWYTEHYLGAERLIVQRGADPVGRCYLWPGAAEIRVMDIALTPEMRGQGIGTRLLRTLIAVARAGAQAITLHVEPHNPAQRLYARLGFERVERRGVYDFLCWRDADAPQLS